MNIKMIIFYLTMAIIILGGVMSVVAGYHYFLRTKKFYNIFPISDYNSTEKKILLIGIILILIGMTIQLIFFVFGNTY